jgi:hypothetical protein
MSKNVCDFAQNVGRTSVHPGTGFLLSKPVKSLRKNVQGRLDRRIMVI